jgi:serine/threonine protein kinase
MGVILFTMVTGAMPYLTEASVTDPLYKLILRRSREEYWSSWRSIREHNKVKVIEEELEMVPNTSFMEDICEAVTNCAKTFFGNIWLFLLIIFNALKFVGTFGQCQDLFKETELEVKQQKYAYSEEFKDLVFEMMSYNHRQRPTLEQIRAHPWM